MSIFLCSVFYLFIGFLVDKFGHYKPVLFISLIMNAVFHHSLMLIPQMETPGKIPPAYVMRHPLNGKVEVSSRVLSYDPI